MGKVEKLKKFLEIYNQVKEEYNRALNSPYQQALEYREYYSGQLGVLRDAFKAMMGDTCVLYYDAEMDKWSIAVKLDHIREFLANNEES